MGDNFTKEQKLAIDTIDKSILVSAAAGSGKTRVLIERIVDIILKGQADVDEMLVVTFTNAAAAEMRLRLAAAIKENIRKHPENRARMREQRDKLYRSYISTFNSFAIRIIKEFFHTVDIEPNFKVCDEIKGSMLQLEAIDELFEEAFENDRLIEGGSFREFLRLYSSDRSEQGIKEDLVASYTSLRSMPDYFAWAHDKAELLKTDIDELQGSELERMLIDDLSLKLRDAGKQMHAVEKLYEEAGLHEIYETKLGIEKQQLENIEGMIDGGLSEELISAVLNFEFPRLPSVGKDMKAAWIGIVERVKSIRNSYKEIIKGWGLKYLSPSIEKRIEEMNLSYQYTEYYLKLLEAFEQRYSEKKKAEGLMDFSDMEHIAAEILKDEAIAQQLRHRFKYIFVDEYQDTNHIQEHLIGRIARPDNIFKVGDIKQSIYKFRQAEPEIFKDTYKRYSEDGKDAIAIDLSMNFRSNPGTVDYINTVFEDIMDGYDEHARLYAGPKEIPEGYDFKPEVHLLFGEEEADGPNMETDDELDELSKEEAEAKYVAQLAQSLIGTTIYDTKADELRTVQARDIVVLLRAVKVRGELYSAAFRAAGIQSHVEEEADYFDNTEIRTALSLLMSIDNIRRDVPLLATLRSEVFAFSPSELAAIRNHHGTKGAFYEAVKTYTNTGDNPAIKEKLNKACARLEQWRLLSNMMPLPDFLWQVLTESEYYLYAGAMYGGGRRQANLRALVDKAAAFSKGNVGSLSDFIRYLEMLKKKKIKNGQAGMISKDDDVVRISTIHKSKGLEYPIVIVAGLGHRFRKDSNSKSFSFDAGIGVGMPYVDPAKRYWRSTVVQRLINDKSLRDGYAEELRVLYVAMTRARNRLILVGSEADEEKFRDDVASKSNYLRVMRDVLSTACNLTYISPMNRSSGKEKNSKVKDILAAQKNIDAEKLEDYREVERRLEYEYPDDETRIKAKYSVSELRQADNGDTGYKGPRKKSSISAADIGTAYHRILEYIRFKDADSDSLALAAEKLRSNNAISEEVFAELDLGRLCDFFNSELGRRAAEADRSGKLKKEKAFTLKDGNSLIQGVIDCCWEENGEMILVDYKSSYINPRLPVAEEIERIKKEYEIQVEKYIQAIEAGCTKPVKEAYLYLLSIGKAIKVK